MRDNNFIARHFIRAKKLKNVPSRGLWNPLTILTRPTFPRTTRTYMITHSRTMHSIIFSWIVLKFGAQYIRSVQNMWFAFQCRQKTRNHVFVPSASFSSVRPLRDIIVGIRVYYISSRSYFILWLPKLYDIMYI